MAGSSRTFCSRKPCDDEVFAASLSSRPNSDEVVSVTAQQDRSVDGSMCPPEQF